MADSEAADVAPEPAPAEPAAETAAALVSSSSAAAPEVPDEAPPELSVQAKGIDSEIDQKKKKEYIVYTFGVYIGHERVFTIEGRFSDLHKNHQGLPKMVASKLVFPSKQAGLLGAFAAAMPAPSCHAARVARRSERLVGR